MAIKFKTVLVRDEVNDDSLIAKFHLYRADAAATPPNHARVVFDLTNGKSVDRPLSDFTSLSAGQKGQLGNFVNLLFAELLVLEGYQ